MNGRSCDGVNFDSWSCCLCLPRAQDVYCQKHKHGVDSRHNIDMFTSSSNGEFKNKQTQLLRCFLFYCVLSRNMRVWLLLKDALCYFCHTCPWFSFMANALLMSSYVVVRGAARDFGAHGKNLKIFKVKLWILVCFGMFWYFCVMLSCVKIIILLGMPLGLWILLVSRLLAPQVVIV